MIMSMNDADIDEYRSKVLLFEEEHLSIDGNNNNDDYDSNNLIIGICRDLINKGISIEESQLLFSNDVKECYNDIKDLFLDFDSFPKDIRYLLIDIRFYMGSSYRFRSLKKLISAVNHHNQEELLKQVKITNWYKNNPGRSKHFINLVME